MTGYLAPAVADIRAGIVAWPIWTLLAWNDIRKRYRRSKIGQFWLTLSMGVTILGMGYVYSTLFGTDITKFIPYVSVTFVVWGFISSMMTEGCMTFVENEAIMRYTYLPRSAFVFRLLCRNLAISAHNVLIIIGVFIYFGVSINWNILWLIPGLALVILNCFWGAFVLGIVCTRYRDVPQIVASVVQIAFFVTPVMFLPTSAQGSRCRFSPALESIRGAARGGEGSAAWRGAEQLGARFMRRDAAGGIFHHAAVSAPLWPARRLLVVRASWLSSICSTCRLQFRSTTPAAAP